MQFDGFSFIPLAELRIAGFVVEMIMFVKIFIFDLIVVLMYKENRFTL